MAMLLTIGPSQCDLGVGRNAHTPPHQAGPCAPHRGHAAEIRARARVDARAGLKIFPGARARVLGKKSTNPAEFCMHYSCTEENMQNWGVSFKNF